MGLCDWSKLLPLHGLDDAHVWVLDIFLHVFVSVYLSRDDPKLLHQAHIVSAGPVFHKLAIRETKDVNRCSGDVLASRRKAPKGSQVGAAMGEPGDDLVSLGDQVVNHIVVIREGIAEHRHQSFQPLWTAWSARRSLWFMIDRIGGNQLVGEVQVSFVKNLFVQLNNDGFVCVG
jgi:hypothetical protein